MLVVSDSSPINFLVRMRCIEILPHLFQTIVIPPKVAEELSRPATPSEVKAFVNHPPAWLEVRSPKSIERIPKLHSGEESRHQPGP